MKPETLNSARHDRGLFASLAFLSATVPIIYAPSGFQPYSLPKLLVIAGLVSAALAIILASVVNGRRLTAPGPTSILVLAFLGLTVLSSGFALDTTSALFGHFHRHDGLMTYLLFGVVFFLTMQISWSPERSRSLLGFVLAGATLVAALAFLQQMGIIAFAGQSETPRVFATTGSPIFLGAYSAFAAVVALSLALNETNKHARSALFVLVVFLVAAVVVSASRSAALGFVVGTIVVMMFNGRRSITAKTFAVAISAAAAIFVFALLINISRGGETFVSAVEPGKLRTDAASRLELTGAGLQVLRTHVWTGAGPSNFPWAAAGVGTDGSRAGSAVWRFDDAHNVWVQIGASIGLPALIIFIATLGIFLVRSRRQAAENRVMGAFAGGLAAILVFATFQPMNVILHLPFWLFIAVIASTERGASGKVGRKSIHLVTAFAIFVLTLSITFFLLKMVLADINHKQGREFLARDQATEAGRRFERAADLAPFVDEYQELLGDLRMQQGRVLNSAESMRAGIAHLEKATEIGPLDPENWGRLALAYQQFNDDGYGDRAKEALDVAEEALSVAPRSPFARRVLGTVLVSHGEINQAIGHLEAAVELDPFYYEGWLWLGFAKETAGRPLEAVEAYEKALLSPDFEGAASQRMGVVKGKL